MADDIDRAGDLQELYVRIAVRNRRGAPSPLATGFCLSCDEELEPGLRWCDAECRDDFERNRARSYG